MWTRLIALCWTFIHFPAWMLSALRRSLYWEIQRFIRGLPKHLEGSLVDRLNALTPVDADLEGRAEPDEICRMALVAATWTWGTGLGICMRNALARYVFLRRLGLPVDVHFGVKRIGKESPSPGISGHAWISLEGEPYHELKVNVRGHVSMFTIPNGAT